MKRAVCGVLAALFVFFLISAFSPPAYAESAQDDVEEKLEDEIKKGLDDLVTGEVESFFDSISKDGKGALAATFKETVKKIVNGEPIDTAFFINLIWEAFKASIFPVTASLVSIVALSLLYGLSKNLSSGFIKESTGQIIYYAVYGSVIATLCVSVSGAVMSAKAVITSISSLVEIIFPVLLTLMAAMGGTATAAVYQPVTLVFTSVIIKVINYAVMPMFFATVVFTIIGNLTSNIKLEKLTKAIQSVAKWTLGIMFGAIISLVTAQGIVGASVDTVSVKSAKFALSSYVPILGGYLSEGFDIVLAGTVLLKNAVGLAAVIILFVIVLAPVAKILMLSLMMKVAAGIVEPISDSRISNLLYSTSKNLGILISVVLGLSFLVFMLLMLMIYTFNLGAL